MTDKVWTDLHSHYKDQDWIDKPSLFAETAIQYFPSSGKVLELGAGQGQDSRFFAEHGFGVVSTDLEDTALEHARAKTSEALAAKISFQKLDLRQELPFKTESFDIVYAHLSLHYFDSNTTSRIFFDIQRILKPGGILAVFTNSTDDPEYGSGKQLEKDYFQIDKTAKRYFSVDSMRHFTRFLEITLLDSLGETYKDRAKGVHNLIRFIGSKPREIQPFNGAIPCTGAIIERLTADGEREVLVQTRWRLSEQSIYNGTLEFPIGKLDKPYENIFDALAREIKEECGLVLKSVTGDSRHIANSQDSDSIMGFRPFYCTQQLKDGKPWLSYIFICEVESGKPRVQVSEAKDIRWVKAGEVQAMLESTPAKFFGLQLPAWKQYFNEFPVDR